VAEGCGFFRTKGSDSHLPHTVSLTFASWNVWNFENKERVRRDEEQAQRDEEEKRERAEQAVRSPIVPET
jgi:hypothetical protein